MKIVVYQDVAGQWRWRAQAKNGRVLADGAEGYVSRRNAMRAVRAARAVMWSAKIIVSGTPGG